MLWLHRRRAPRSGRGQLHHSFHAAKAEEQLGSRANIKQAKELQAEGRTDAARLAPFRARDETKPAPYSFESTPLELDGAFEKAFRRNARAWRFFQDQAPWYRRTTAF